MPETMTIDEKLAISNRAFSMIEAGNEEEGRRLLRTAPMPSYLAKVMKETMGADFLLKGGYNLSEAEAEFGRNWLSI